MLSWTRLSIYQSSLQGCTSVKLQRSDLQGGGHRVRARSTKAIRHKVAHPSAINIEVICRTISYVRRALDPNPNVLLHGVRLAGEANANTHTRANKTTPPLLGAYRGTADI